MTLFCAPRLLRLGATASLRYDARQFCSSPMPSVHFLVLEPQVGLACEQSGSSVSKKSSSRRIQSKSPVLVGTSRVLDFCSKLTGKFEISRYTTSIFFRRGTGTTQLDPLLIKIGNFIEVRVVNASVGFLTYCRHHGPHLKFKKSLKPKKNLSKAFKTFNSLKRQKKFFKSLRFSSPD